MMNPEAFDSNEENTDLEDQDQDAGSDSDSDADSDSESKEDQDQDSDQGPAQLVFETCGLDSDLENGGADSDTAGVMAQLYAPSPSPRGSPQSDGAYFC